jgi:hypothetical protein
VRSAAVTCYVRDGVLPRLQGEDQPGAADVQALELHLQPLHVDSRGLVGLRRRRVGL